MYSFIICIIVLVASYFIYGKIVEKTAGMMKPVKLQHIDCRTELTICPYPKPRIS